jgi:hypothetical protein
VFCRDSEEESKQGDFQMVFASLLLCFPLEGEAAGRYSKSWPEGARHEKLEGRMAYVR